VGGLAQARLRPARLGHPAVLAPHPELLWELSALHLHWLCAYDPEQRRLRTARLAPRLRRRPPASPRLGLGVRHPLDRDRPTRQTVWPGEDPAEPVEDIPIIAHRDQDFVQFVLDDVAARRQAEDEFYQDLDPNTGEVS
jgi:hypothetical protein